MTARRVVEVGEVLARDAHAPASDPPSGPGWEELPPLAPPADDARKADVRPSDLEAVGRHTGLPLHKRIILVNLRRRWDGLEPVTTEQLAAAEARLGRRNRMHMTPAGWRVAEPTFKEKKP